MACLLHIVARGKIGRSSEAELVDRYLKRVTGWGVRVTELPDIGGKSPPFLNGVVKTVALDERGSSIGSKDFAQQIGQWRDSGVAEIRFMIGAADGHSDEQRTSADMIIGFSALTWPHMLARAMLAEQLWRATSILANHPYHREG